MGWPNDVRFSCPACGKEHYYGAIEKGVNERQGRCHGCNAPFMIRFSIEVVALTEIKKEGNA